MSDQFELTSEQQSILDGADRFAREELAGYVERMDAEDWWPPEAFPKIGAAGFFGITTAEEYGGLGLDILSAGLVVQGFARWNHALALSWIAHENLCLNNIARNASEEQKRKYLPGLCAGTSIGCLGITEPGAGSDALGSMATKARQEGNEYVINGSKIYITNSPVADVIMLYAKTNPAAGAKGISAFIVEKGTEGFEVVKKLPTMGFRGLKTAQIHFDECRVPTTQMVGEENSGISIVMSGLDLERAMISPLCLGIAERALEISIEFAKTRVQFGKPIGSFQMIQAKLADMYVWVETMRTFTYRVLMAANEVEIGGGGRGQIHALSAASVMYAAETLNKVLNEAVQIHGGNGYIFETEINRLFRATKLLEIGAGTTEVRKIIISEQLLT